MREPRTTKTVGFVEKLGFCTFSGANNIVYQFKNLYYLFFLTNVVKLDILWAGTIFTIGILWDAINDPLIGYIAVNRKFKNGESVRPFALWHSIPWAATVVLLFTDFNAPDTIAIILSIVIYLAFEIFNTFVGIPYNSMAGLASDRDADRKSINIYRNLGGCIGSAVGAVACMPLLKVFGALDETGNLIPDSASRGFLMVAIVMGVIVVSGSLTHFFTTKERVKQVSEETEHIGFFKLIGMLLRCKSWIYNTIYIVCYLVINMLLMTCLTYYATYVLGSTAAAMPIQAAYLASYLLTSFIVGAVDKKLGRRKTMMLGALIAIAGKLWFLIAPAAPGSIYLNAITVGAAVTFAFVLFNTNRNNIVDIIEADTGRRIDGMIASADNLASKLAVAGATQLVTIFLSNAGYNADLAVQPAAAIGVINFMLGWAPAILSVVMIVSAYFLPIEKDYERAQAKLRNGVKAM
ncbi:MAG TPA: MFS transporter [Clostridia bacterium]|nr:MFS transporter [Clostridia bacterium]